MVISAAVGTCSLVPPRNALASAIGEYFSDARAVRALNTVVSAAG